MTLNRIISLEGGRNFRDLGGYPTADGRVTRWRTLFRSGSLCHLTPGDMEILDSMGIRAVFDLRNDRERSSEPHRWPSDDSVSVYQRNYSASGAELARLVDAPSVKREDVRQSMIDNYRLLPYEQAEAYQALFEGLAAGRVPALFNCSAGKDRTGIAAALLLSILGVPHDIIIEDYVLTERAFDFRTLVHIRSGRAARDREVTDVLIAAHPDYLNACFNELNNQHGGVSRYFSDVLGIPQKAQEHMRNTLLTEDRHLGRHCAQSG